MGFLVVVIAGVVVLGVQAVGKALLGNAGYAANSTWLGGTGRPGTNRRPEVYEWPKEDFGMHRPHLALLGSLAAFALLLLSAPAAFAGGWAVTTLDELPATLNAGETYAVGYTIRQHGLIPLVTSESAIEIRDARTGAGTRFPGQAHGDRGHYVARVVFPSAGEWQWSADQRPFQAQSLGAITIAAAASPAPIAPAPEPTTDPSVTRIALPSAALLATLVFGWRVRAYVRRPRPALSR